MKLIIFLTIAALVAYVDSHARLADPVNRGSLWRIDEDLPETEEFEWCSDPEESGLRKVKCGICGPIYNNDPKSTLSLEDDGDGFSLFLQSFERESPLYTGRIVKTYRKGSVIQVTIEVEALHDGGIIQFGVWDAASKDPTQATLDANLLVFAKSGRKQIDLRQADSKRTIYDPDFDLNFDLYTYDLVLPPNLTCEHCLFQWQWASIEFGQKYMGCADVKIIN